MTKDLKSDRWTCPNDRNLQLRSKLNAGWSCHTGKKTLKKDSQLTESELIEIQKVLQRSEMLERNERDRVIKLVERLENMKRNATQSVQSPNRCALCGDYFCLLRSTPNQCAFCHRILCTKCCIDTQYAEDDASMASLASSQPSRRNSSNGLLLSTSKVVWLCRLCSEQREFLKKSGAWFLKKYPSYLGDEKFSSASNVSQMEKSPSQFKNLLTNSPSTLKRNISSSSSNSLSLRFWRVRDGVHNYGTDPDNYSDISNENEYQHEVNSNNDSNSITTRTVSSENLVIKTPSSPNKKPEHFSFPMSINHNNNNNNNHYHQNNNINGFGLNSTTNMSNSPTQTHNSHKKPSNSSNSSEPNNNNNNDDDTNKNMLNYNYYSSIISNLSVENQNLEESSVFSEVRSLNNSEVKNSSPTGLRNSSTKTMSFITSTAPAQPNPTTAPTQSQTTPITTTAKAKTTASTNTNDSFKARNAKKNLSSITNGIIYNSLSASASNLESNENLHMIGTKKSSTLNSSSLARRSGDKRSKILEWCSTQLSIDLENGNDLNDTISNNEVKTKSHRNLKNYTINPKISSQTVNNLNRKLTNNNISNLDIASASLIAASTSSAVASVTSLASSLSRLNLNQKDN